MYYLRRGQDGLVHMNYYQWLFIFECAKLFIHPPAGLIIALLCKISDKERIFCLKHTPTCGRVSSYGWYFTSVLNERVAPNRWC